MRVVDLYPKDICVTLELSLKEIEKVLLVLDKAELKYDGKNPKEIEAVQFVKEQFFTQLDRVYEDNKQHVT